MGFTLGVLVASLLGSVHCAGMCGGFVCFYTAGGPVGGPASRWTHVAYNGGRLASYLTLGAVAGALGASVDRLGALAGLSRAAAILSGTLMVAWGASTLLATRGIRLPRLDGGGGHLVGRSPLGRLLARVRSHPPVVRAAATGLLTTLLPCGWLYAFVAAAAGTGHVDRAMLSMGIFWLGTLPMMVAVGVGAQRLSGPLRRRLPLVTATVVVVIGLLSIAGRLTPGSMSTMTMPGRVVPFPAGHGQR